MFRAITADQRALFRDRPNFRDQAKQRLAEAARNRLFSPYPTRQKQMFLILDQILTAALHGTRCLRMLDALEEHLHTIADMVEREYDSLLTANFWITARVHPPRTSHALFANVCSYHVAAHAQVTEVMASLEVLEKGLEALREDAFRSGVLGTILSLEEHIESLSTGLKHLSEMVSSLAGVRK